MRLNDLLLLKGSYVRGQYGAGSVLLHAPSAPDEHNIIVVYNRLIDRTVEDALHESCDPTTWVLFDPRDYREPRVLVPVFNLYHIEPGFLDAGLLRSLFTEGWEFTRDEELLAKVLDEYNRTPVCREKEVYRLVG